MAEQAYTAFDVSHPDIERKVNKQTSEGFLVAWIHSAELMLNTGPPLALWSGKAWYTAQLPVVEDADEPQQQEKIWISSDMKGNESFPFVIKLVHQACKQDWVL